MKKKLLKAAGVVVVVFVLVANVQYALVNYGLGSITPGIQLVAQTNGTSTDGTSTDGTTTDGTSSGNKVCGTDECEKSIDYGVPPYHVIVTKHGHYQHCKLGSGSTCSSSNCDVDCDAT